jgi:hypothetical protein
MRSAFWTTGKLAYYRLRGCKSALIGTNYENLCTTFGQLVFLSECNWRQHETLQTPGSLCTICQTSPALITSPVFPKTYSRSLVSRMPSPYYGRLNRVRRYDTRNDSAAFPLCGRMSASYSPNALRSTPLTSASEGIMHTSVVERGGWGLKALGPPLQLDPDCGTELSIIR